MAKPRIALNPKHPERLCWGARSCAQLMTFAAETELLELSTQLSCSVKIWIEWELDPQGGEPERRA